MASSYTPILRLTLPTTGELQGTWGDTVNNGITSLTEAAIAGTAAVVMSDADHTLTVANGATDEARRMFVTLTGTLSASRNVICPAVSKMYVVRNNTTGGQSIVFKTSAGTGVTVANGQSAFLYCDGTNVVEAFSAFAGNAGSATVLQTARTLWGQSFNGSANVTGALSSVTTLAMSGQLTNTVATGTAPLVISSTTRVANLNVATAGTADTLTTTRTIWGQNFNGSTNVTGALSGVTDITASGNVTLSGGTANGVAYLNASKVLTTGSALTFDGTNIRLNDVESAVPALTQGMYVGSTTNNAVVGYSLRVQEGTNNRRGSMFLDDSTGVFGWDVTAATGVPDYVWRLASSEQMRLTSTGLGIGTSSPGYKLTVAGTSGSATVSLLETGVRSWGIRAGGVGTNTFDIADFTAGASRLTIDSSGNLGFGTTSPTNLLDVNANSIRVRTARTPASATAAGNAGEICWDSNYVYVCVATDTWRRAAIATW